MMTDHEWIKRAAEHDLPALLDGIKAIYNCRRVDIDNDGDVWIADPQRGHWIDDDDLARIAKALRAGDI